jgi:hypothetical protein
VAAGEGGIMKGYMTPEAVERFAAELPRNGIIQFVEDGQVAVYRADSLSWSVSGHERAWGDAIELVRKFGPYVIVGKESVPCTRCDSVLVAHEHQDVIGLYCINCGLFLAEDPANLTQDVSRRAIEAIAENVQSASPTVRLGTASQIFAVLVGRGLVSWPLLDEPMTLVQS